MDTRPPQSLRTMPSSPATRVWAFFLSFQDMRLVYHASRRGRGRPPGETAPVGRGNRAGGRGGGGVPAPARGGGGVVCLDPPAAAPQPLHNGLEVSPEGPLELVDEQGA